MQTNENNIFILPTDSKAIENGCYIDLTEPNTIKAFAAKCLTIQSNDYSGESGRRLELTPWQEATINTVFGWRRKDGTLRFREVYLWLGRRQGKSLLASIIATYFACKERKANVCILASTKEEGQAVYDRITDYVDGSSILAKRFKCQKSHLTAIDKKNNSTIKVLSGSTLGKVGKSISCLIVDETAFHPAYCAREIWAKLLPSLKDKINALVFSTSTPGFDLGHIWHEKYRACKDILDGKSDDWSTCPILYSGPDNWRDDVEAALIESCPSLDITIPKESLLEEWTKAEGHPLKEAEFETWFMARPVGSPEIWIAANDLMGSIAPIKESDFYGAECVVGCDFAACFDITVYTLVFEKEGKYYCFPRYFIPADIAQKRSETDHFSYIHLANKSNLTLTSGNVVDVSYLVERLKADAATFRIKQIRADMTRFEGSRQLIEQQRISEIIDVRQSSTALSPPLRMIERLFQEGKIVQNDNPLSLYCFNNCRPKERNGKLMVDKSGDYNKIDYVDSLAFAFSYFCEPMETKNTLPPGQKWAFVM